MVKVMLAALVLASVGADLYICRFYLGRRKAWRTAYIVTVIISYVAMLIPITVIRNMASEGIHDIFVAGMWATWFFFLVSVPKLLFLLFSWPDRLAASTKCGGFGPFSWLASLLAGLSVFALVDGAFFGRRDIRVEKVELQCDELPESFDGLRIVQFSDTHIGTMVNSRALLGRMVGIINKLSPDIVVQSGDIVNLYHDELTPEVGRILSRIRSRYGVYAVYGNHDLGFYVKDGIDYQENIDRIRKFQEDMGWTFLNNANAWVSNGTDSIAVVGLNYPADLGHNGFNSNMGGLDLEAAYAGVADSVFDITISHAPQPWRTVLDAGRGDLVLSGHVHSMQSKIRIGDWQWSPARFMYREWGGLYEYDGRYLYINDGIGCVMYPMRIGAARPEVTLIVLRSESAD